MPELAVSLFGNADVTVDGRPYHFRSIKTVCLLAYLAVEARRIHQRRYLAGLLWSEADEQRGLHNLRQTIYELTTFSRRVLPEADPLLLVTRTTVQFNSDSSCQPDVARFDATFEEGRWAEAAALYGGEFLEQINPDMAPAYEEWLRVTREQYHRQAIEALEHAVDDAEARGAHRRTEQHLRHLLELEPWREDIHRRLMRLLATRGQRGAALAQYDICRQQLAGAFDATPSARTRQLYDALRTGAAAHNGQTRSPASPPAKQVPHNLPPVLQPLIGRRAEMAYLRHCLTARGRRLLTVAGPAGIGKTHLVLQVARQLAQTDCFPDGVYIVDCSRRGLNEPRRRRAHSPEEAVAGRIGAALALAGDSHQSSQQYLLQWLCCRTLLLVLDGWNNALPGKQFLQNLLNAAPKLTLLVTASTTVGLPGETPMPLEGLGVPSGRTLISDASAEQPASVRYFLHCAAFIRPGFRLTAKNQAAVFDICRHLKGHPRALHRAAGLLSRYSCKQVAMLARWQPKGLFTPFGAASGSPSVLTKAAKLPAFNGLQQKKYVTLFNVFDRDGDGYLTKEDFAYYAVQLGELPATEADRFNQQRAAENKLSWWNSVHSAVNKTASGRVSLLEWLEHWAMWQMAAAADRQLAVAQLEQGASIHFDAVDRNGRGRISATEFGIWLCSVGYAGDTATVFRRLDSNNDGLITRAEVLQHTREFHFSRDADALGNLLYGPLNPGL